LANLGIAILRGRDFNSQDTATSQLVAIVSESTAKASWPGQDPIGKRFRPNSSQDWITVIGLAADARLAQRFELSDAAIGIPPSGLGPQRNVYLPYPQRPNRALVLAVRTDQPQAVVQGMRAKLNTLDPTLPVYEISLLEDRLKDQDQASRAVTTLTVCYAGMALFLAALGLFGLLAHAVSRRTQEIGIRMALGALPARVLRMILAEGLLLAGGGMLGGSIAAVVLTRIAANLLFGVSATDPEVYASILALLLVVASLSCYVPARRATRVDPMVALRYD
jgi:putative ABC transport system permease protein